MKSYWFLFWACTAVWLGLSGYLLLLLRRVRRVGRRLDLVERRLGRLPSDS